MAFSRIDGVRVLCCFLSVGAVVLLFSATTSNHQPDAVNLLNVMPAGTNRGMQQQVFNRGLHPAGFYGQHANKYRPQDGVWAKAEQVLLPYGRQAAIRTRAEAGDAEESFKGAESWSKQIAEPEPVFDILKVKDIIPHRYPFLLVDKIIEFVPGKKAVGIKKVTTNEEFFNGHFPNRPIMPGVLQVEAMAQVGGIIALQEPVTDGKGDFFFAGVNNIKWRKPVVPGDTLVMEMELTKFNPRFGIVQMKGAAYVDGTKVVDGDFSFAMVK
jgi:3-hydroxyacyl-[acyl-carrier-protein] dehydratase